MLRAVPASMSPASSGPITAVTGAPTTLGASARERAVTVASSRRWLGVAMVAAFAVGGAGTVVVMGRQRGEAPAVRPSAPAAGPSAAAAAAPTAAVVVPVDASVVVAPADAAVDSADVVEVKPVEVKPAPIKPAPIKPAPIKPVEVKPAPIKPVSRPRPTPVPVPTKPKDVGDSRE